MSGDSTQLRFASTLSWLQQAFGRRNIDTVAHKGVPAYQIISPHDIPASAVCKTLYGLLGRPIAFPAEEGGRIYILQEHAECREVRDRIQDIDPEMVLPRIRSDNQPIPKVRKLSAISPRGLRALLSQDARHLGPDGVDVEGFVMRSQGPDRHQMTPKGKALEALEKATGVEWEKTGYAYVTLKPVPDPARAIAALEIVLEPPLETGAVSDYREGYPLRGAIRAINDRIFLPMSYVSTANLTRLKESDLHESFGAVRDGHGRDESGRDLF